MNKRVLIILLTLAMCCSGTGCGRKPEEKKSQESAERSEKSSTESSETIPLKEAEVNIDSEYGSLEDVLTAIDTDTGNTIDTIKDNYSALAGSVDSYEKYVDNVESIKAFFTSVETDLNKLFEAYDKYYEAYFKLAMETCADNKELDRAFDDFYDRVYGDAFDDIYDDVYNRVFDDYYDDFYNGIVEEGRDIVAYNTWSDVQSQCYSDYSDAHTKCYIIYTTVRQQVLYEGVKDYDKIMEIAQAEIDERAAEQKRHSEEVDYTVEYEVRDGKAYVTGISGEGNHATINMEYEDCDVVGIDASAFEGSDILSVLCWADIETIGDSAFKDCTGLLEFSVSNETTVIGNHAFENCSSLKDLIIWGNPDIGESAFANCTSLEEVNIGSKTEKVCDHAFDGCSSLESVIVWGNDTQIGKDAFANCPKLTDKPKESGKSVKLEGAGAAEDTATEKTEADPGDGIRPEFQKAMDEYVDFFEEYCGFMKTYSESDNPAKLLSKYNDYMKQYTEAMTALEELEGSDMSKAEQKLYLDTMNTINKMLIDNI